MTYHFYRNTKTQMPAVFDVQREQPVTGPELRKLLWDGPSAPVRENFGYGFALQTAGILKQAEAEGSDSVTILLDQAVRSENEHRFDHFEEEWTRVLYASGAEWREISVRNCADDYNTWVQICCRDHLGTAEDTTIDDKGISVRDLLEHLPELCSLSAVAALAR